ncbi:DUF445 domain-containing protein [Rouxiella sp. WC2420]|uniref:DUF445 domain-containing protein n=1 Tax=Rouxiella sp. WC2420 TaxID=3234145 RepID=A0AB39VVJ7_9GAMM
MNKENELRRSKRNALLLLLIAAALFVVTLFLPQNLWINGVKAISEAAMVGALADWFAVVALFKRVPIPFVAAHTAIIPKNKNKIADNLAIFVQEKFLDPGSLVRLIRQHDPAQFIGKWLTSEDNTKQFGSYLLSFMRNFLDITDDKRIQQWVKDALYAAIDKVDLTKSVAALLESLTKDGRHQALLDQAMQKLIVLLDQPASRQFIATQIIRWVKREHPIKSKMLPTEWLGENGASMVSNAVNSLLDDIGSDRGHAFRQSFDRILEKFIARLQNDPQMAFRAEEIKSYLKNDPKLSQYIVELWSDLRNWIKQDLDSEDSRLHARVAEAGLWLGNSLSKDPALRSSLNQQMEVLAEKMAPDFAQFLTRHISDTVKSWDEKDMSRQIELNIGKDLQFIRINGTLVGAGIGLILYLISQLPLALPLLWQALQK